MSEVAQRPLTYVQAAERLGCSKDTVAALARAGELHAFSIGTGRNRFMRIPAENLQAFIDRGGTRGLADRRRQAADDRFQRARAAARLAREGGR